MKYALAVTASTLAGALVLAAAEARAACGRGPCSSPDPVGFFPSVAGSTPTVVTNFGLLVAGLRGNDWQYVCDDAYGRASPQRLRQSPDGQLFMPTTEGLLITRDGCQYATAGGDIAGQIVFDVAMDERKPSEVFALGNIPRELWRSSDAGATFRRVYQFPNGVLLSRVLLPPTRTREVYVIGRGIGSATPVWRSTDDGATFEARDAAASAGNALQSALELVSGDPRAPDTLYFSVVVADGDELWRSQDGGASAMRLLKLREPEALTGLAFGPLGTMYVGGNNVFQDVGKPRGHFYLSRDDGKTWEEPIPSGPAGPQFSCLVSKGAELYACGLNQGDRNEPLVALSRDEGKTWTPVARMADFNGPKGCVAERCQAVGQWLCDTYRACEGGYTPRPDVQPAPVVDAGAPELPAPVDMRGQARPGDEGGDCGCGVGAAAAPRPLLPLLLLAGWLTGRSRRSPRAAPAPRSR